MRRLSVLVLAAALALAPAAQAHGIWIVKRLDRLVLALGHSDQEDPYPPGKLVTVDARDAAGAPVAIPGPEADGQPYWSIPRRPEIALMTATYRGSYSGQTATGEWRDVVRGQDPPVLAVGRYDKYNLTVLDARADVTRAAATRMQIRPLINPLTLNRGDPLTVQVLFEGRPAAGVAVAPDFSSDADLKTVTTDADGRATIRVVHQGLNVIAGMIIERPSRDSKADFVEHIATLSFGLRPQPHWPNYMHPEMQRVLKDRTLPRPPS